MLQSSLRVFRDGLRMLRWVFMPPALDHATLIQKVVSWSVTARKEGLLALEAQIPALDDPFIAKGLQLLRDLLRGRPGATWRAVKKGRGMDPWRDVVDWVGGLPFEVAKPEQIFEFCRARGFILEKLYTCAGGHGCNQYVFRHIQPADRDS